MQNQRQQFIKSKRRKNSPKFKLQSESQNHCQHKIQRIQNEEYTQKQEGNNQKQKEGLIKISEQNRTKNINIVADLKYQLSFLKDQIAKISNQKAQKKQNQINRSNGIDSYYFPNSINPPIQRTQKDTSSLDNNCNSQQKIEALKFKKLKNLQKKLKSIKSTQRLDQKQKRIKNVQLNRNKNEGDIADELLVNELKKVKSIINDKYQTKFKQLTKECTMIQDSRVAIDKHLLQTYSNKDQEQSPKEQKINKNLKATYQLKSMKMKKTIKDNAIQIQSLKLKIKQQEVINEKQKQNKLQQINLIEALQKELSLSKMKILTLENAEKQLLSKLNQVTSHCKCKQLQHRIQQKQVEISSLEQKLQRQQSLFYNKQLQTLKLQRTIINLEKEKYNANIQKQNAITANSNIKMDKTQQKSQKQMNLQLKQIIKIQQKSLINLQSDLRFLQHELNLLTGVKILSRKQTKLITELNQKIFQSEIQKLNKKYTLED